MKKTIFFILPTLLAGCKAVVLHPAGEVAARQADLLVMSTLLMLVIILPVMALTALFAWKYRAANKAATYAPEWDHSTKLELVIWAVPLLIIIALGALTWLGTHLLDPYRPLTPQAAAQASAQQVQEAPLEVDVVALDWKWLFIYPQYGIATVNELAVPVDRPVTFRITASSVMNAFYVPNLAGMIYAMPGMETKLHAILNAPVTSVGFSANYSGAGFSHMRFAFKGLDNTSFTRWVEAAKTSQTALTRELYLSQLEPPSENTPVTFYGTVDPDLYAAILNMCVNKGKMCMGMMMGIDAKGGLGEAGLRLTAPLMYDKYKARGTAGETSPTQPFLPAICDPNTTGDGYGALPARTVPEAPPATTPLRGYGLKPHQLLQQGL